MSLHLSKSHIVGNHMSWLICGFMENSIDLKRAKGQGYQLEKETDPFPSAPLDKVNKLGKCLC